MTEACYVEFLYHVGRYGARPGTPFLEEVWHHLNHESLATRETVEIEVAIASSILVGMAGFPFFSVELPSSANAAHYSPFFA